MYKVRLKIVALISAFLIVPVTTETHSAGPVDDNGKEVIVLFDLHRVILDKPNVGRALFKNGNMFKALGSWITRGPRIKHIRRLIKRKADCEEYIQLARKHKNTAMEKQILDIMNIRPVITGTANIINQLDANGYRVHFGSNIDPIPFDNLLKRRYFKPIWRHFDKNHTPQIAHKTKNGSYLKKPDPEFFREYLANNKIDLSTTRIIFVDDLAKNVQAAQSVGLDGIVFKNASQLRRDLIKRGIQLK